MDLEALLEAEGLDADAAQRTLEWARGRAAEIVADLPDDVDLSALLDGLPSFDAEAAPARPRPVQEEASVPVEADLPPPPEHVADAGDAPEMVAGVPDTGSLEALMSEEIELLDDDDLDLVEEDEELEEEDAAAQAVDEDEATGVVSPEDEPVADEPAEDDEVDAGVPEAAVDDDISIDLDLDLSDLDDL